jgi:hypothetical protein
MPDDDNLQASVEDGRNLNASIDKDVEFLQGKAEGWQLDTGRWQIVGRVIMYGDVARGWSQVQCMYYLVFISLHVAHL